jgi:hypothetical protein
MSQLALLEPSAGVPAERLGRDLEIPAAVVVANVDVTPLAARRTGCCAADGGGRCALPETSIEATTGIEPLESAFRYGHSAGSERMSGGTQWLRASSLHNSAGL